MKKRAKATHPSVKKTTYQIRLPEDLLAAFLAAARDRDRSPAGELRECMRTYIKKHAGDEVDDDESFEEDEDDDDDDPPF